MDIHFMLDGLDWVNDREWERAMFVKTTHERTLTDLWELSYPHFRQGPERVVKVIHPDEDESSPSPPVKTLGD